MALSSVADGQCVTGVFPLPGSVDTSASPRMLADALVPCLICLTLPCPSHRTLVDSSLDSHVPWLIYRTLPSPHHILVDSLTPYHLSFPSPLILSSHPHTLTLPHTFDALHPNVPSRKDVARGGSGGGRRRSRETARYAASRGKSEAEGGTSGAGDSEVARGSQGVGVGDCQERSEAFEGG